MQVNNHTDICIEAKGVSFLYGDNVALKDITFSIKEGEYVGIVGPNGGGKTTLLKLILGLLEPAEGQVTIYGHSVQKAREHFEIGYVPQKAAFGEGQFPATVREIVTSGRVARVGVMRPFTGADRAAVSKALEMTGITALADRLISSLSGGERQRVFIARALAGEPKMLILDEPTVGVDVSAREQFYKLLSELHKTLHLTIVLVSHDIDVVAAEVTTVLCLNETLECHLPSQQFNKQDYLKSVYGGSGRPVAHGHH